MLRVRERGRGRERERERERERGNRNLGDLRPVLPKSEHYQSHVTYCTNFELGSAWVRPSRYKVKRGC